jgi:hypothetical protein
MWYDTSKSDVRHAGEATVGIRDRGAEVDLAGRLKLSRGIVQVVVRVSTCV